jgi:hypothetical protein
MTEMNQGTEQFHALLKAFATALAPHIAPSSDHEKVSDMVNASLEEALENMDLDDAVQRCIEDNDSIPNMDNIEDKISEELSYNANDYGIMTNDSFDPSDHDLVTNYELDQNINDIINGGIHLIVDREYILNLIADGDFNITSASSVAA